MMMFPSQFEKRNICYLKFASAIPFFIRVFPDLHYLSRLEIQGQPK